MTLNDYVPLTYFQIGIVATSTVVAGAAVYKYVIKPWFSPLNQMPGPTYYPFIGNVFDLNSSRPMEFEIKWTKEYGKFVHFHNLFNRETVMITCPKAINYVLITNHSNYEKQKAFQINQRLLGDGIMVSTGKDHARHRGMILPTAFSADSITVMTTVFNSYASLLCKRWRRDLPNTEDGIICVQSQFSRLTLDIMGHCTFGFEFGALSACQTHTENVIAVFNSAITGELFGLLQFIPYYQYLPLESNRKIEAGLRIVQNAIDSKIALKRKSKIKPTSDADLLDIIMDIKDESGKPAFTDKQLRDNILTFLTAGRETATATLSWALFMLARYPNIQNRARVEVLKVMEKDRDLTNDDLQQLKYVEFVIMETLRLHPPVDVLRRVAKNDDVINNYKIPSGTLIHIAVAVCQRFDEVFENGTKFNPDRFENQNVREHGVLSFSVGSRTCMGKRFAMTEIKIILAKLLLNFKFSLPTTNYCVESRRCGMFILPYPLLKLKVEPIVT